jgi:5,10-methylenetetrahydromethanopterin reductase
VTASTAPLRLSLGLLADRSLADALAQARLADELGFGEVWVPEVNHGRAAFTTAALIAAATHRIDVGIGVVNPFWRHPSLIAMEAATLDEASGGRARLGLGAAIWSLRALGEADPRTERGYSAMLEATRVVRALLRGEAGVDGSIFPVRANARLDFELARRDLPIYLGPVNRRMLEASGALADGVELGALMTPGYIRWAWEQIESGARSAGRDPAQLDLAAPLMVSVADDGRAARDLVRRQLAYYLFRVEAVVIDRSAADPAEVAMIRATVGDHGVDAGAARISDALIDEFAVAGEPDHVAARLQQYIDAGLRGLIAAQVLGPDRLVALRLLAEHVWPKIPDKLVGGS